MSSLTAIAADIRKHSPGVLPESLVITSDDRLVLRHSPCRMDDGRLTHSLSALPDDIAEAVLRYAMTADIAPHAVLIRTADAYRLDTFDSNRDYWFHDSDHGGRTQALHAAWRKARGITD